jgi:protein-L-isoaspartate(D-aspartate) O-methyltransferase
MAMHAGATAVQAQTSQFWERVRNRMVDEEIVAAGVTNPRVIRAMRMVPRHEHVPADQRRYSYLDMALPIGNAQTISPPFVVAFMTEAIDPQSEDKVLEIGTGSGYQAAILSHLVKEVYTIEIVEPLGKQAAKVLEKYPNVHAKSATDTRAGRNTPRSTRSSSPARRRTFPRNWSSNSRKEAG